MKTSSNVWGCTQCELFLTPCSAHLPNDNQPRMHPYTDGESDTLRLLQPLRQVFQGSEDTQASTYRSLCVIFMGVGIAKIDEESISKQLGDMSVKTIDDLSTDPLVCLDDFSKVLRIESA